MGLYFHRVVVGVLVLGSWSGVVLDAGLIREWVWFGGFVLCSEFLLT